MSQIARVVAGAVVAAAGYYQLRSIVWDRTERVVDSFREVQAELPGARPIPRVAAPKVPLIGDREFGSAIGAAVRAWWNLSVVSGVSAVSRRAGTNLAEPQAASRA